MSPRKTGQDRREGAPPLAAASADRRVSAPDLDLTGSPRGSDFGPVGRKPPVSPKDRTDRAWAAVLAIGTALVEASSISIALIDADATVRYLIPEGLRAIDSEDESRTGSEAFDWLQADDLRKGYEEFRKVLERPGGVVSLQVRSRTQAGSYRWVEAVVTNLLDERDVGALVVHSRDITDWKRVEHEVVDREARLQLLLEQLPTILWTTDRDLRVTLAVGGGFAAVPWDPKDLVGKTLMEIYGEEPDPDPVVTGALHALVGRIATYSAEWEGRTWRCHVEPLTDAEGAILGTLGVALDITRSTLAAEQLERSIHALRKIGQERRELLARLVSAQENERVRVAREMHDHMGQLLASASLLAKSAEEEAAGTALEGSLGYLRQLMQDAQASARSIVASLRAVDLDEEGLRGAISHLAAEVWQRHGIEVHVHVVGLDGRLPREREIGVYRIVQEALSNAIAHASPTAISVVGSVQRDRLVVLVEDDGRGFRLEEVMKGPLAGRLGIVGMQERATAVGGDIHVESCPGSGTRVRVRVPMAGE